MESDPGSKTRTSIWRLVASGTYWYGYPGAFVVAIVALGFMLLVQVFGHDLIRAMYEERSLSFLNKLISGRAQHPLGVYLTMFDDSVNRIFVGLAVLTVSWLVARPLLEFLERRPFRNVSAYIAIACVLGFGVIAFYAYYVLEHFPKSGDEYAYVFQAATFNHGRLWNDMHPLQEFFNFTHIAQQEGKWVSRFPPGWPIILAFGQALGVPSWLVNPILSVIALWVFFLYASRRYGQNVAGIATVTLLCSSFFLFNGASYFTHMSTLLLVLLFYHHGALFLETGERKYAMLAGAWIGFAFITRPYTAVLAGIPLLAYTVWVQPRRLWSGTAWLVLGSSPFILFLLFYNYEITGHPLLLVTKWMDPKEGIGFVKGHDWKHALSYTVFHFVDFIQWASPTLLLLLPVYLFYIRTTPRGMDRKWGMVEFMVFAVVVFGYAFYYLYGGDQYGPRFYFEAYPFVVLVITAMVFAHASEYKDHGDARSALFRFLYVAGVVFSILYIPLHTIEEHREIEERSEVYKLVERAGIKEAVVLLNSEIRRMQTRNGTALSGDVIYALDLGEESNRKLPAYFPNKKIYRYIWNEESRQGALVETVSN